MKIIKWFNAFLTAVFIASIMTTYALADFGVSGWGIFRKVQSAQFTGISAVAPVNSDLTGVLYNPAVLATHNSREMSLNSEQGLTEDKFGSVIYAEPLRNGMLSAGFAYYDAGTVELNWLENGVLKTENVCAQKDMMGIVSFQQKPNKTLSWGISCKLASSELAQRKTAYAYAADAGLLYLPNDQISVSFAAQNFGISDKFIEKANPLPTATYVGFGYMAGTKNSYIQSTLGATYLMNDEKYVPEVGIELGAGMISVNAGFRNYEGEANMHIGMRIALSDLEFGYAFLPASHLSSVHRLSIGYKFKTSTNKTKYEKTSNYFIQKHPQVSALSLHNKFLNK